MLWKKNEERVIEPVDIQTGIGLLQRQIEQARALLKRAPIAARDNKAWNEQTAEVLTRIYGEGSPNIDTIVGAAGEAPVWLFMPDDAAEKYEGSRLENKIRLLEGCVVALKRKERESQIF
jgi:hypothetical protein